MFKFSNVISENVWKDRYSKNGEDLTSNFDRVARFCSAENQEDYIAFKEMLENAGLGIAMENSAPYIKEYANIVTSNNNSDGVAEALNKYIE